MLILNLILLYVYVGMPASVCVCVCECLYENNCLFESLRTRMSIYVGGLLYICMLFHLAKFVYVC